MNFAKAVIFAMRNGLWHCEISHCEIFALRIWYCEIFALRNWNWHCEISHCEIFALRMWYCENFRIAKIYLALRSAQCPAATVPLLMHPAASHPASTASHFLHFALVFPLIYGLFDG